MKPPSDNPPKARVPQLTPEFPTEKQTGACGDFAFLYMRSDCHRDVPLHMARLAIQPPIDLSFYKVFHNDGVPRYGVIWAFLSPEAEAKLTAGEVLTPSEWYSGSQTWIMEIIAPYGQGTAEATVRWLKQNLPEKISTVRSLRVERDTGVKRIVEFTRGHGPNWGARVLDDNIKNQKDGDI